MAEFDLSGFESLYAKLKLLKNDAKYKGGRSSLRKAAKVVEKKAKSNAARLDDPETAANIEANITTRFGSKYAKATGNAMFRVGVLGGAGGNRKAAYFDKLAGKDTRHWRMLEFGREGQSAQPFMRPALQDSVSEATNTFAKEFEKTIDRAVRKANKGK
jgi:HK97 gp10 family phage protein